MCKLLLCVVVLCVLLVVAWCFVLSIVCYCSAFLLFGDCCIVCDCRCVLLFIVGSLFVRVFLFLFFLLFLRVLLGGVMCCLLLAVVRLSFAVVAGCCLWWFVLSCFWCVPCLLCVVVWVLCV